MNKDKTYLKPSEYLYIHSDNFIVDRKHDFHIAIWENNEFGYHTSTHIFKRKDTKQLDQDFIHKSVLEDYKKKLKEKILDNQRKLGKLITNNTPEYQLQVMKGYNLAIGTVLKLLEETK